MRKIILALVALLILGSFLMKLPSALNDPQWALRSNISFMEYVWEPLRRVRIRLNIILGASPNDIIMGESTYSLAASKKDLFFLKRYAPLVSPEVFLDTIALACESTNDSDLLDIVTKLYEANLHSAPPACHEEILLTPAPWRGRQPSLSTGRKSKVDRE